MITELAAVALAAASPWARDWWYACLPALCLPRGGVGWPVGLFPCHAHLSASHGLSVLRGCVPAPTRGSATGPLRSPLLFFLFFLCVSPLTLMAPPPLPLCAPLLPASLPPSSPCLCRSPTPRLCFHRVGLCDRYTEPQLVIGGTFISLVVGYALGCMPYVLLDWLRWPPAAAYKLQSSRYVSRRVSWRGGRSGLAAAGGRRAAGRGVASSRAGGVGGVH